MLKNENNDDLISRKVNEEYIYFIQLWRELTDSRTLDSYQAKLLYIISAFKELIEVIKNTLNSSYSTDHNIEACKDELSDLVSGDLILKKHYPDLQKIIIKQLHISSKQFYEEPLFISSSPKAMSYPPRYPLLTVSPLPPFGDPSSILLRNLHISL